MRCQFGALKAAHNKLIPVIKMKVHLCQNALLDLKWWEALLGRSWGVQRMISERPSPSDPIVTTDASTAYGVGGFWGFKYFMIPLPERVRQHHSTKLELLALWVACHLWANEWVGKHVLWRSDCEPHVRGLFKIRTKSPELLKLHKCLDDFQADFGFLFSAVHLPGKKNQIADQCSRGLFKAQSPQWHRFRMNTSGMRQLYVCME